ncbi:ABC transporter substrate-binding protein [Amycolatopsis sp. H6(2020)]|nr:ABC transporter substrate-binding protein [Amycolatopsis sp. H6(2020)]
MRPLPFRRTGAAVLAAILAAALTACGGGNDGGQAPSTGSPTKVTVGVIPILDVAPLYLGVQKGIFTKHGLDVTPQPAQGGAAIVPAVLSGQNQIGFSNVVSLLTAREKGLPLVAVAGGSSSTGNAAKDFNAVLVGKTSSLQSAKDLAGKKIAINSLNNIGDTTVKVAVAKAGGDPAGVTFVEMPFQDMPAQLSSGKIDAAWVSEPFVTAILAQGGRVLFDSLTDTYASLQVATYFTSQQTKQQNPKLVEAFTAAINESLQYATAHPDEARSVVTTYTKIAPDAAAKLILPAWPAALDQQSAAAVGDAAHQYGTLKNAPDVKGLFGQAG